jgi:hypothetical protein
MRWFDMDDTYLACRHHDDHDAGLLQRGHQRGQVTMGVDIVG